MRLFIAVKIPQKIKDEVAEFQKNFQDFDIKFVEKQNLHINLKFLGEVQEADIDKVKEIMDETAKKFEKFKVKDHGLGVFPSFNYIRVLWIGVTQGKQELKGLSETLDNALVNIVPKEKKKMEPHLTLGRVRTGRNRDDLVLVIRKYENVDFGELEVNNIILYNSTLTPQGPEYKEVYKVSL